MKKIELIVNEENEDQKRNIECSIIIPIRNAETTICSTLNSLYNQSISFGELIIINNNSNDNSKSLIHDFLRDKKSNYRVINQVNDFGLAHSYNAGIKIAKYDFIVILHSDVFLEKDALKKLLEPFDKNPEVVATFHIVEHPYQIWGKYNFWQKVFFARLVGKKFSGLDGKFDCFRKDALFKVGLFDELSFRTAGEDGDIVFRLKKIGKIMKTDATIIHLHNNDQTFNYRDIIHKQSQYSEAQGVLLRKGRIRTLINLIKAFFREILVIILFIPFFGIISFFIIILYSFFYTKVIYFKECRDPRCIVLPFFNVFLLFISLFYAVKGFLNGKQRI